MRLLIFAFRGTIAESVARALPFPADVVVLDSTEAAIDTFVQDTPFASYSHVLGLGVYSGRDQDRLRTETACTSQFRNQKETLRTLAIPYFLRPDDSAKLAAGMGNSWCNLVSYRLLTLYPDLLYTFLHIPKTFAVERACAVVGEHLSVIGNNGGLS